MSSSILDSVKIKAKLLQKAKQRAGKVLKLKDAFEILAKTAGFKSWREWREVLEDHDVLLHPKASSHWHIWYSSYEEAKAHLEKSGGYLLPYQKHFFLCNADYLMSVGIAEDDADLIAIGRNWVEPKSMAAYRKVQAKIKLFRRSITVRL